MVGNEIKSIVVIYVNGYVGMFIILSAIVDEPRKISCTTVQAVSVTNKLLLTAEYAY